MSLPEVCVVYLIRAGLSGPEVLLGRKLTGLGLGKVVAPGGKLEPGESPKDAAVREVREEVGLNISAESLELVGELTYPFPSTPEWSQKSWAFRATGKFGEPAQSEELAASWIPVAEVPLQDMWDDAKYWLPGALEGFPAVFTFEFGSDLSTVVASDHALFGGGR